ncbi:transposable element Tcb2 transposase [Trichonephila clavipes]|nr:transposable element Tcb2 transposase [Trichonephila clavipes]
MSPEWLLIIVQKDEIWYMCSTEMSDIESRDLVSVPLTCQCISVEHMKVEEITWTTTRGRMIGKLEEGRTVTSVAAEFGIYKSVVLRALKAFQTTGTAIRKVGGGYPRTTTAGDERYIILQAKRGRRQSASVIAQQLSTATW